MVGKEGARFVVRLRLFFFFLKHFFYFTKYENKKSFLSIKYFTHPKTKTKHTSQIKMGNTTKNKTKKNAIF
jgi:hypothetical protein